MWYMCMMKYYSASKGQEILTRATTQMNLKVMMLSETSPSQKDKDRMIVLTGGT